MAVKNVKLVFDRRHRATPDTPAAVEFAVPMGDGRRRIIPTGVRLCAGQWDAEASRVQFHPDAAALNRRLLAALQAANAQIVAHLTLYGELTAWRELLILGDIYALITTDGLRTVKRLRRGPDGQTFTLQPSNPDYDPQPIRADQIARVFKVLTAIKRF